MTDTPKANMDLAGRLRYEADAMYAGVNGQEYGDTFHCCNWADKPHRVVYDAIKLMREAADALCLTPSQNVPADLRLFVLQKATHALKPLADAVFNDNGDQTVTIPSITAEQCIEAYFAEKHIRAALPAITEVSDA